MKPKPKRKRKEEFSTYLVDIDANEATFVECIACMCCCGGRPGHSDACGQGPCRTCNGHGYLWRKAVKR